MAKKPERILLVYTTTATRAEAERIARALLKERLVACANSFPISSQYWWKGRLEKGREVGLLLKTRRSLYSRVEKRVKALHAYTVPAIEAWELARVSRPFRDWLLEETKGAA
jgi:periplasmic divalent cation tolerance protein